MLFLGTNPRLRTSALKVAKKSSGARESFLFEEPNKEQAGDEADDLLFRLAHLEDG